MSVSATGLFAMHRPRTLDFTAESDPYFPQITSDPGSGKAMLALFGTGVGAQNGVAFYCSIESAFDGHCGYTQLIQSLRTYDNWQLGYSETWGTGGQWMLDNLEWSEGDAAIAADRACGSGVFSDSPRHQLGKTYLNIEDNCLTYLRFRPDDAGSIWVTLSRIQWGWNAHTSQALSWIPEGVIYGPNSYDSIELPQWQKSLYNSGLPEK
jgi:hypothetical protein